MSMLTRHKRRSRRSLYVFRAAMVLFGLYFAYHAFHGDHGLIAHAEVQQRVSALEAQKLNLEARKGALEARVAALRDSGLDGDLVDERARSTLGLIHRSERIVLH
ncbi:MAG: septum formation initiator family protein [Devosiaceae bacterium]|nr:septum formation initiator family protein [Devosiaceae bacterium MH13]